MACSARIHVILNEANCAAPALARRQRDPLACTAPGLATFRSCRWPTMATHRTFSHSDTLSPASNDRPRQSLHEHRFHLFASARRTSFAPGSGFCMVAGDIQSAPPCRTSFQAKHSYSASSLSLEHRVSTRGRLGSTVARNIHVSKQ